MQVLDAALYSDAPARHADSGVQNGRVVATRP